LHFPGKPEEIPAARILSPHELLGPDLPAKAGDLDPLRYPARNVHVKADPWRNPLVLQKLLGKAKGDARSPLIVRTLLGLAGHIHGNRKGRDSSLCTLHGCGDRAGVGHIPAEVRAGIDPGHNQIRTPGRQSQNRQKHTIRRRTIGHMHDRAIGKLCGVNAEGFVEDPGPRGRRPVLLWRQNPYLAKLRKNPPQGM
jgi:hypothetical protein